MITLENISVTYPGGIRALLPTSVRFERGQFTVLLGPSGAGKSTLLRSINHLCSPTTGTVWVDSIGPLTDGRALRESRRRTGMIFQHHQLLGRLTALSNVIIGRLGYHTTARSLLPLPHRDLVIGLECLDRVGLLHKSSERADALSGGEQQRVGIARALAQRPRLILADEPVASLDPATSAKVLSLLYSICQQEKITAIVSLHQVELARTFADRVLGVSRGRIVFDGGPEDLTPDALNVIYGTPIPKNGNDACAGAAANAASDHAPVPISFMYPDTGGQTV
jgi:phosphonate transport system ATP-binding protein